MPPPDLETLAAELAALRDAMRRAERARRADIEAAMAERAECVMLHKGPHVVEAMRSLDSILRRMETHQDRKRNLARRLRSWTSSPAGDVRS